MKRVALLLVLLLSVGAAITLFLGGPGGGSAALPEEAGAAAAPGRGAPGEPPTPGDGAPRGGGVERAAAQPATETAPPPEVAAADLLDVQVVLRDGGAAVPGALVQLIAPGENQERELSEAFFTGISLDALFERFGSRHTADAQGMVRLPRPRDTALIAASKDAWYGMLTWNVGETSPGATLRLEVETEPVVRVRVRDERGQPVAGVPVALRLGEGDFFAIDVARTPTGPDGISELLHARSTMRLIAPDESAGKCTVAIAAVLAAPVSASLDLERLPAEPVELVLPPTGSVRVTLLDEEGKPYLAQQLVALSKARENPADDDDWLAPGMPGFDAATALASNGEAFFPHVGLGFFVQAAAQFPEAPQASTAPGPGPQRPGEEARLVLRQTADFPVITALLRGAEDRPLISSETRVRVMRKSDEGEWDEEHPAPADAEGRVRFGTVMPDPGVSITVAFELPATADRPQYVASVPVPDLHPGLNDLGTVILKVAPVIAAGRVVNAAGDPVAGATVVAQKRNRYGEGPDEFYWEGVWRVRASSAADGSFTLYGTWQAPELRLEASAPNQMQTDLDVPVGTLDALITLAAAAALEGRILADPGVDLDQLSLRLQYSQQEAGADGARGDPSTGVQPNSGRFRFDGVRPGFATFTIDTHGFSAEETPLFTLPNVHVGGPPDSRLDPVDLRGLVHGCRIRVRGEGGAKLKQVQAWPAERQQEVADGWQGQVSLLSRAPLGEIVVVAPGWREARFTPTGPEAEVELKQGMEVRITTAAGAVRQGEQRLGCFLVPEDGGVSWARGARAVFDDAGAATLRISTPGKYRVEFLLTQESGPTDADENWWGFKWIQRAASEEPPRIVVADVSRLQTFAVAAPSAERIAATVQEFRDEAQVY